MNAVAADTAATLTISRHFDAPPERVFEAWLDPEQISRWMGPRGVRAEATQLDARVGGGYAITMHKPDNSIARVTGAYKEIKRHSRLAFTWTWLDEIRETLVTLTFKPAGKGTDMTLQHTGFSNAERRDQHNFGWNGSLDKLAEALAA